MVDKKIIIKKYFNDSAESLLYSSSLQNKTTLVSALADLLAD